MSSSPVLLQVMISFFLSTRLGSSTCIFHVNPGICSFFDFPRIWLRSNQSLFDALLLLLHPHFAFFVLIRHHCVSNITYKYLTVSVSFYLLYDPFPVPPPPSFPFFPVVSLTLTFRSTLHLSTLRTSSSYVYILSFSEYRIQLTSYYRCSCLFWLTALPTITTTTIATFCLLHHITFLSLMSRLKES